MSTIDLEVRKASLAREILTSTNQDLINNLWALVRDSNYVFPKKQRKTKRKIGILEGKATVTFHDDWSMTPEELDMV
jgi:hypothetical protein